MSHDELILRAMEWLASTRKCTVVMSNAGFKREVVDAIGWLSRWSILVECKTSVSDFHADKRKACRQPGYESIGQERWYLTPPKLLRADQIPERWGLLEAGGKMWVKKDVRPVVGCWRATPDPCISLNEVGMLVNHHGYGESGYLLTRTKIEAANAADLAVRAGVST